ncbi:hypothetical protein Tco_0064045 [Tanacetum coccineum]
MDQDSAHMVAASKVSMLKPENGATLPKTIIVEGVMTEMPITTTEEKAQRRVSVPQTSQEEGTSVTKMSVLVTAEEKTNKKNDVKAMSFLLMALPNEHQLTFSQYTDAKIMYAAIKTRFGGVIITPEDLNSKFLRSLPPEWNTYVVVWMNKADIETMSIDDLYNNFKIVEQEVKKSIGASTSTQNMACMTTLSTSSTNEVNTANSACKVSTVSPNVNTSNSSVNTANINDDAVYAFMVANPNGFTLLQQDLEKIHEDNLEAIDLKECRAPRNKDGQFRYQDNSRNQESSKRYVNVEDISPKAMLEIDGVGYDWSDMVEEQIQTNMALMAFSDSELNDTEFKVATYKRGLSTVEEQLVTFRKNEVLFSEEIVVLKREVDKLLESQITDKSKKGLGYHAVAPPHPLSLNAPTKLDLSYSGLDEFKEPEFNRYGPRDTVSKSTIDCDKESDNSKENTHDSLEKDQVSDNKNSSVESSPNVVKETIFHTAKKVEFIKPRNNEKPVKKTVSFGHMKRNCPHHQRRRMVTGNNYNMVDYDYYAKTSPTSSYRNMTPRAVLLKAGLKSLSTLRSVCTAHPKPIVNSAKSMSQFSKQAQSTIQRPFYKKPALTNRDDVAVLQTSKVIRKTRIESC